MTLGFIRSHYTDDLDSTGEYTEYWFHKDDVGIPWNKRNKIILDWAPKSFWIAGKEKSKENG